MLKFFYTTGSIIGYIVGLIGAVVTILLVQGTVEIEIKWLIFVGIIILSLIIFATRAIMKFAEISKHGTRFEITAYDESDSQYYYTNYSSNLRVGTLVSIYYICKPSSKRIGFGKVSNTSDQYVEIKILSIYDTYNDIFELSKLKNNKILQSLYVLPNVYMDEIPMINKMNFEECDIK